MPEYAPKSILEEQLKRGDQVAGEWPWRLLIFMIVVFGLTVFIYAGMNFGYAPYLDSQLETLDKKIADLNGQVESDEPKALIALYSQLVNIQNLLNSHPMPSKFLAFLQKNTDPSVYYVDLNLSLLEQSVKLSGVASDYNALVRQTEFFRRAPEVKTVFLDDSKTREQGDVQFTLRFILTPEIFK